jgi:hypothetical protein
VHSAVSVAVSAEPRAPLVHSKKFSVLSRLKVRDFLRSCCDFNQLFDVSLVKVAVSRQVTAFRKRSEIRKQSVSSSDELRRTRSCSCFVRVKWQKMVYSDVQVALQDSPLQLKLLLEKLTEVPVGCQKLVSAGKPIRDNATLYESFLMRWRLISI